MMRAYVARWDEEKTKAFPCPMCRTAKRGDGKRRISQQLTSMDLRNMPRSFNKTQQIQEATAEEDTRATAEEDTNTTEQTHYDSSNEQQLLDVGAEKADQPLLPGRVLPSEGCFGGLRNIGMPRRWIPLPPGC
jgi:hypothetical protein